jgi:hypothetical protein
MLIELTDDTVITSGWLGLVHVSIALVIIFEDLVEGRLIGNQDVLTVVWPP